jgi:ubiquitin-like 1-activating enzyme E1 B
MNPQKFPLNFFQPFHAIILALDNEQARSYLNRICGPLGIPLFEAGTSGFAGQTYPIVWNRTRCYDCLPKPKIKTFPVCTIRTVPTRPVHCMVWAKQVFNELFDFDVSGVKGSDFGFGMVGW